MNEHATRCTMLELILKVRRYTHSDTEIVTLVKYLVNSGQVELSGSFAGTRF